MEIEKYRVFDRSNFDDSFSGRPSSVADGLPLMVLLPRVLVDHWVLNTGTDLSLDYRSSKRMTLVTTLWRDAAGVGRSEFKKNGAYKSFSILRRLLNYYDDLIDDADKTNEITIKKLKFGVSNEISMHQIVSDLVSSIRFVSSNNYDSAGFNNRLVVLSKINEFRRQQYRIYQKHEVYAKREDFGFDEVVKYREITSGATQQIMAATLNAFFPNLDITKKLKIETAFYYFGAAGQFVDDIADWWKDKDRQLNIFSAALDRFPEEKSLATYYKKSNPDRVLSVFKLRNLAPKSTKIMNQYFTRQLKMIPIDPEFDNFRRILGVMYWVLPDLYARTESKPFDTSKIKIKDGLI